MEAEDSPPGYVVVANAEAGSSARAVIQQVAGRIAERAPTEVVWLDGEGSLDAALDSLQGRRLVVAGGDGTIHLALNRLSSRGSVTDPLAVVPAGTGNDFARGIGIGTDPVAAAEVAVEGAPRWLAAIEISGGELAHNNVHVGLGVVAVERGARWKPRLGHLAYPAATIAEGLRYGGLQIAVELDGEPAFEGEALAVLALLGPSMGGGLEVVDGIEPEDPRLDIVVVQQAGGLARIGMAVDAARNRLAHRSDVGRWTATRLGLRTSGTLHGDVDGELRTWEGHVELRVRPRAWRVIVPTARSAPTTADR